MRKVILNLAMSLDGYIATEEGHYDWIKGSENSNLNTSHKWDYAAFLDSVDLIIMGKTCYDQKMHLEFNNKKIMVLTHFEEPFQEHITFFSGDIGSYLEQEKQKTGKNIYIFGGAKVCDQLMQSNGIDDYIVGIIPIILGKGKPLFYGEHPTIHLMLKNYYVDHEIVIMHYEKRIEAINE